MRAAVVVCLVLCAAVAVQSLSMETLKASIEQDMELGQMRHDMEAQAIFRKLEASLFEQLAKTNTRGMTCSPKLTWAGAVAYFSKKKNNGQGVKKFEEWVGAGVSTASLYIEANVAASAGVGISAGLGVAFEFKVEAGALVDSAVSLCANWDINIGVQFGASAGGTVYLIFGPIEKANDSNCGIGAEVFAGIGGGIQVMLKCPGSADEVKAAWNTLKAGYEKVTDKKSALTFTDRLKAVAKGTVAVAKAAVIGVAFSAGVGVGGTPVSATYSIADFVKGAIPDTWKDWADNKVEQVKAKWTEFKAWVKK